jgi:uncharacterized membrane protein YgdD (TMEM256/DUF423 family)
MRSNSWWTPIGAVLAGTAVMTGAIAAHGIDSYLAEIYSGETREVAGVSIPAAHKYLDDFKTASRYQMMHGMGLIVVGLLAGTRRRRTLEAAGWSLLLGTLLFSGNLYLLSLTADILPAEARHVLGLAAATGGTLLIIGWFCLAAAACPCGHPAVEGEVERA